MKRLGRWMLNALTILALLLCVATSVLWVRSYRTRIEFRPAIGLQNHYLMAHRGMVVWSRLTPSPPPTPLAHPFPTTTRGVSYWTLTNRERRAVASRLELQRRQTIVNIQSSVTTRGHSLATVCAALAANAVAFAAVGRRVGRSSVRGSGGVCPSCSYDLTGNVSGVCPECGIAIVKGNA